MRFLLAFIVCCVPTFAFGQFYGGRAGGCASGGSYGGCQDSYGGCQGQSYGSQGCGSESYGSESCSGAGCGGSAYQGTTVYYGSQPVRVRGSQPVIVPQNSGNDGNGGIFIPPAPESFENKTTDLRIDFNGKIVSTKHIWVRQANGFTSRVPVINGYLPQVQGGVANYDLRIPFTKTRMQEYMDKGYVQYTPNTPQIAAAHKASLEIRIAAAKAKEPAVASAPNE